MTRFDEEEDEDDEFILEMKKKTPQGLDHPDGMPDGKRPQRDPSTYDGAFPTKISVSLDDCPHCGGDMDSNSRACIRCGKQQAVLPMTQETDMAPLAAGAVALEGLGGAAGAAGGATALGGESAAAGSLMNSAMAPGGMGGRAGQIANQISNPMSGTNQGLQAGQQLMHNPMDEAQQQVGPAMPATLASSNEDMNDNDDKGHDDFPFGEDDDHEDFIDVGEAASDDPHGLSDDQKHALHALHGSMPLVIHFADSEEDGSNHPVLQAIDDMLEAAFPGYRDAEEVHDGSFDDDAGEDDDDNDFDDGDDNDHDADKDDEDVSDTKEASLKEARKPKMCGFHDDLVGYALTLGDPQAALNSVKPSEYGKAWCKSGEFEGKCNYKPAMVTQQYWDDKDAEYQQRKQEREEQAALQTEQEQAAELDFIPADTDLNVDFSDEQPEPLIPADAPSAVGMGAEPEMSAVASVWLDTAGEPLQEGSEYILKHASFEPELIVVEDVNEVLTYSNQSNPLAYRDRLASAEGVEFEKLAADDYPDSPESKGNCKVCGRRLSFGCIHTADGSAYEDDGSDDGDDDKKESSARTASEVTAGALSSWQIQELIDEPGTARNARQKLDLSNTHYGPVNWDEDEDDATGIWY